MEIDIIDIFLDQLPINEDLVINSDKVILNLEQLELDIISEINLDEMDHDFYDDNFIEELEDVNFDEQQSIDIVDFDFDL